MIRAWRYASGGRLAKRERPDPDLQGDDVLLEVEAAVLGEPELRAAEAAGEDAPTPGGAAVGRVVAAGEEATGAVGARALVGPHVPCGECELCRRGAATLCREGRTLGRDADGALASHVVSRARWICRLEGELEVPGPAAALLAREAADAYALYARAGVAPGEPVVVVGDGAPADLLAAVGRAKGTRPLLAAASEEAGAVRERASSTGIAGRPWKIFETSATSEGRALALELAGPACTVTFHGAGREDAPRPLDLAAPLERGVALLGVPGAHPDFLPEVTALAVRGELDVESAAEIVSGEPSLDRAREALERRRVCVVAGLSQPA